MIKQVIVWRGDLKELPLGKKMGQAAHASHLFLTERIENNCVTLSDEELEWVKNGYRKIVLLARTLEQLLELQEKAKSAGLHCHLVQDAGHTVFSEPTITCLAIGPNNAEEIDKITSGLRLV